MQFALTLSTKNPAENCMGRRRGSLLSMFDSLFLAEDSSKIVIANQ